MSKLRRRKRRNHTGLKIIGGILVCAIVCAAVFLIAGFLTEAVREKLNPSAPPLATAIADAGDAVRSDTVFSAEGSAAVGAAPANPMVFQQSPSRGSLKIGAGEPLALPLSGLLIGIDPGHQASGNSEQEPIAPNSAETKAKVSTGTQGAATGTPEYEVNLIIALKLRDALNALGAEVVLSRSTNDINISNVERAQLMNAAGADLVLRLHCNGSTNSEVNGIGLYVNATGEIAEPSYAAAAILIDQMAAETGARAAGIYRRDTYTGLNWSEVPCILVEMGYMSNPEEDIKLESAEYQALLVRGMTKGVAAYFERTIN